MRRYRPSVLNSARFLEGATGLGMLLLGLTIYSNHGFESSMIFFLGFLMIPLGILLLGTALVMVPVEEEF